VLYPMKSWEPIVQEFSLKNQFDPKVREFRRQFFGGATEVELDTAGRLLLPPTLKEYAGLTKDIILVAALNNIEIWDANKYKKLFEDLSPEAYSKLAADVMGNKNVNDLL
jgi:MraZ protein